MVREAVNGLLAILDGRFDLRRGNRGAKMRLGEAVSEVRAPRVEPRAYESLHSCSSFGFRQWWLRVAERGSS